MLDRRLIAGLVLFLFVSEGFPAGSSAGAVPYTSDQKAWALGTCAVLTQVNKRSHQALGGRPPDAAGVKGTKALLSKWWSVHSRDELLAALKWIDDGGHRKIFDSLASAPEEQVAVLKARNESDPETFNQITVAREYGPPLGSKSILGWDYARYVSLCGWGFLAGYLTEDEAWDRIMPVAQRLQSTFGSWDELGANYLIGRRFWSLANTEKTGAQYDDAVKWLETTPDSPWLRYAWTLGLNRPN